MNSEVKVPVLPESVSDATVAAWHAKAGDTVRRDQNLVDLETDKVVLEVPAPVTGTLRDIRAAQGATVQSGDVLALIEEGAVAAAAEAVTPPPEPPTKTSPEPPVTPVAAVPHPAAGELPPAARKLAAEHGLEPNEIPGSGRRGRVTKGDVLHYLAGAPGRAEERVKMSRLRQKIAERMKEAQNTAAILTSFNEVNLQAVMDLRARYQDEFTRRHGVKLGLMSFFVKACCEALARYPVVNASSEGDEIVYHGYMDIGIAVATERGLVVPVLRHAEQMSLAAIETAIRQYAEKARNNALQLEDLQGGTFTITNGGTFGSLLSTPLLNPPQSAILGMHAIKQRPVVEAGEIVARPMMYTALSYDHRIIDGKEAVLFLVAVKEALEDPARLLLGL